MYGTMAAARNDASWTLVMVQTLAMVQELERVTALARALAQVRLAPPSRPPF